MNLQRGPRERGAEAGLVKTGLPGGRGGPSRPGDAKVAGRS